MARWRTLADAARETGISRRTLNRLISRGELRVYTVVGDRRHYVDLDQIEQLRQPRPKDPKDPPGAGPPGEGPKEGQ